jgi:hypothetical protein
MHAALQQQPQLWCAFEAILRVHGWLVQQQSPCILAPQALCELLLLIQQPLTSPLLSMLLSLCKLTGSYGTTHPALALACSSAAAVALCTRNKPPQAADGSDRTSSSSSSSSSQQLWTCAVMARVLHTLAEALKQAAAVAAGTRSSSSTDGDAAEAATLRRLPQLDLVCHIVIARLVEHLGFSAVLGIDPASQQQLRQLGNSLLAAEAVDPAMQGLHALRCGNVPGPELQHWAQQLQQFAAAAAAAVPLAAACNNPCCCALGRLSEAALVKGRRCSRCKAGYCSDACQAVHWKEHKKACKLLAAAGARAWALQA